MYRLTVPGFLPAFTWCSMNARITAGSAGRNDSPRSSQNAWKIGEHLIPGGTLCGRVLPLLFPEGWIPAFKGGM